MELVEDVHLSDFTKKTLEQFGWAVGEPIPADLGQLMLKMKETLPPSKNIDVLIDKELLSEEQTKQIVDYLATAKEFGKRKQAVDALNEQTQNMDPSVAAVYQQLLQQQEPEIIDDRDEAPAPAPAEDPAPKVAEPEPTPPPLPVEAESNAAAPDVLPFCPRCGWDMRQQFETHPTDRDKEDFLATLLGGQRFTKTYELFGGKIIIRFRSLLADENKLIYRQLVLDQQENRVATEAEWFAQMMDYRLACALDTITQKDGKVVAVIPPLDELKVDPGDNPLATALPKQLDLLNQTVAQEVTRRLVGTHLRQFQRLVEALEAMALEPSFWNGIE
jgi:hypothetical protein